MFLLDVPEGAIAYHGAADRLVRLGAWISCMADGGVCAGRHATDWGTAPATVGAQSVADPLG